MGGVKTATPSLARAINDRLALDLLLAQGPLTAPQLRELTGLSRPTVSDLIERLQAHGLIAVAGESGEDRRGPNAKLYGLVPGVAHVAGVDVRRNAVFVTVADITGQEVGQASRALEGDSDDVAAVVGDTVRRAAGGRTLSRVVIGAPGLVHPHTGVVRGEGVPGWRADLLPAIEQSLGGGQGVPADGGKRVLLDDGGRRALLDGGGGRVLLENDVNLAAIAEHRSGAATDRDDFALFWLDDGVGGAIVLDGRVRRGASGGAGEVAMLDLDGTSFCCAIEALRDRESEPGKFADYVARGVFAVVAVLDPGLVVLGGTIGREGGDQLAAVVRDLVEARSPAPVEVRASTVEGNAILRGAVASALTLARDEVFG